MPKAIKKTISDLLLKIRNMPSQLFKIHELKEFHDYLSSPWRIMWTNFLAGTMRGLGFLIGAAFVLAIIGYVLKELLVNIPIVGDFFKAINEWIQATLTNGGTALRR